MDLLKIFTNLLKIFFHIYIAVLQADQSKIIHIMAYRNGIHIGRFSSYNVVNISLSSSLWIAFQLYRPLNVRVALIAVEIWTQADKIVVDEDSDKCLDNFMKYRNEELVKNYDHDNAQLLT